MLCLENWYYRILILMTGYLKNATLAVDALSICMSISGWEMMIPLAFLAATGTVLTCILKRRVRVANELGAGNGKAAKFATVVAVAESTAIGLCFCLLILILRDKVALLFTSSTDVLQEVYKLQYLLALSILFNSVQPVLSGVAVGSGLRVASECCVCKPWVLLRDWAPSWDFNGPGLQLGCYGNNSHIFYHYYLINFIFFIYQIPLTTVATCGEENPLSMYLQGIWGGMILGGTAVQTVKLAIITIRCDWGKEARKASQRMEKWSDPSPNNQS
ncbi:hypothetical protein Ddye_010717 [Dipteronia dyeriana]|uniref:Uncharacterized protein n=1 Tax=Dipteronia dyeriana TaxID=168575 RepID=A0AAD9XE47_9ROSI|nr:hypothetical protein Ddye_010717 [Dipteronia dyeriana]